MLKSIPHARIVVFVTVVIMDILYPNLNLHHNLIPSRRIRIRIEIRIRKEEAPPQRALARA